MYQKTTIYFLLLCTMIMACSGPKGQEITEQDFKKLFLAGDVKAVTLYQGKKQVAVELKPERVTGEQFGQWLHFGIIDAAAFSKEMEELNRAMPSGTEVNLFVRD